MGWPIARPWQIHGGPAAAAGLFTCLRCEIRPAQARGGGDSTTADRRQAAAPVPSQSEGNIFTVSRRPASPISWAPRRSGQAPPGFRCSLACSASSRDVLSLTAGHPSPFRHASSPFVLEGKRALLLVEAAASRAAEGPLPWQPNAGAPRAETVGRLWELSGRRRRQGVCTSSLPLCHSTFRPALWRPTPHSQDSHHAAPALNVAQRNGFPR